MINKHFINISIFYVISVLMFACQSSSKVNFDKLNLNTWYAGEINDKHIFIKFEKIGENNAEGAFFIDENKKYTTLNKLSLNSKIKTKATINPFLSIKKIEIEDEKLILTSSKKTEFVFSLQPEYNFEYNNRYKDVVFSDVKRKEVKYGAAEGFYQSKSVSDMSISAYPYILSDVFMELSINPKMNELSLYLDVYMPDKDIITKRPLLVLLHAGAFIIGDKREKFQETLANYFAKKGYVVASINYRLGYIFIPGIYSNLERCIYRAVQDTRAAIRFLVHNKNEFGIDENVIFLAGNSAGGFIATTTAFMSENEIFESAKGNVFLLQKDLNCLDCSGNSYNEKFKIKGVINMWGALTNIDIIEKYDTINTLLIHGDNDKIVPCNHGLPFRNVHEKLSILFSNKVYGSQEIYKYSLTKSLKPKLLTIQNGDHEPYMDKDNKFNANYELIENAIDSFLLDNVIVKNDLKIKKNDETTYMIYPYNEKLKVFWTLDGGYVLNKKDNKARIVLFENADKHMLNATVIYENGYVDYVKIDL